MDDEPKSAHELEPIDKDVLRRLEDFDESQISPQEKAEILLVAQGIKPACIFSLEYLVGAEDYTGYAQEAFEWAHASTAFMLEDFGLPYHEEQTHDEHSRYVGFLIGTDLEHLKKLTDVASVDADSKDKAAIGKALGYPQTAIEAFVKGDSIGISDLPGAVRNSDAVKFLSFGLSRDHWKGELAQVSKQAQVVKKVSPAIYQQVISTYSPGRKT